MTLLLTLLACDSAPTTTPEPPAASMLSERAWRPGAGAAEPWIRDAELRCVNGWWEMRVNVVGSAPSAEWIIDLDGVGEPHRMVADGWSAVDRLQQWTNESPYNPDRQFQVESAIRCEGGLHHLLWIQGIDDARADCVLFGPDAASLTSDPEYVGCTALIYEESD